MFALCSRVLPIESRAVFLALAALYRIAWDCRHAPAPPSLHLRALLAFLYLHGDGRREPFDRFWRICQTPDPEDELERGRTAYMRTSYSMTEWEGIRRAVGVPGDIDTMSAIRALAHRAGPKAQGAGPSKL
ncbi:MAG: hypothetical protein A4S12_07625 [Proteobacteria bacterium SG_bin5]|nr:MAG: hypothetical protein A4S12_07625 [Proteobacteria bacterium SG_bin5]